MSQLIISVGREFGSGGHELAEMLAKYYKLHLYDHSILKEIATKMQVDYVAMKAYDETKKIKGITRTVKGMSSSHAHNIAQLQFKFLKKKAEKGESFVVVGRCGESVLKENPALISLFVLGDEEDKVKRVMEVYDKNEKEALKMMKAHDKYRKNYHNSHFPDRKWGDSRNYDLSINSSKLGEEETFKIITAYIDARCK